MASEENGEKTEEATQQRREDFRKRGQVAQTRELSSVLLLFSSVILIWLTSRFFFQQIYELFFVSMGDELVEAVRGGGTNLPMLASFAVGKAAYLLLPVLGVYWLVGFASSIVQIGFMYNEEALQIKWERLDPVQGFKKMFSLRAVTEGVKAVAKVTLILFISYLLLKSHIQTLPSLMNFSVLEIFEFLGSLTVRLLAGVGFFMLCLASADYFYQTSRGGPGTFLLFNVSSLSIPSFSCIKAL